MSKFKKQFFVAPENIYSPGYFWIINGKLDTKKLCAQLDDMAVHGIKAVCFHPFPKGFRPTTMPSTMSPDYMSDKYMEILSQVMDHAEKLGMNAWLYDEGGWPSGGCCGQVMALNHTDYAAHLKVLDEKGNISDITTPYNTNGPAPYPSVIELDVTDKFIELTHEKWRKSMARHFGKTIKFTFTDEPNMPSYRPGSQLTWTKDFAESFKKEKGYDITPFIPKLLEQEPSNKTIQKIRVDFCDFRAKLFLERFLLPIRDWCRKNNLLSGGHLNGEDVPEGNVFYGYGHILQSLRALDVPGVDVIWRQLYPGEKPIPFPKYASSAAHQNGSKCVLSESFAIYGDGMPANIMKWVIDYQLVRGITVFVFGYSFYESNGMFMTGIVPNFSETNTIWDFMAPLYSYAARIGSLLANGSPAVQTAVLYDIRAIWAGGNDGREAVKRHFDTAQKLLENQQDFDFIDDSQIASAHITSNGLMKIGKMSYNTIVLPTHKWMSQKALEKLEAFQDKGGCILDASSLSHAPKTCVVTGKGNRNIRVTKRDYSDRSVYFFVNESYDSTVKATITLPDDAKNIVVCDTESGKFIEVPSKDGRFIWEFAPCGSALFMTNTVFDIPAPKPCKTISIPLDHGWELQKIATYRAGAKQLEVIAEKSAPVHASLGDWSQFLGESFSGKATYSISFDCVTALKATLDLGKVCHYVSVKLNGKTLPQKFFAPFVYPVSLKKGTNTLEITVANTMNNTLSAKDVRQRIISEFPPQSPYEDRLAVFDKDYHESGLFGPVSVSVQI
ncbi:MAG: hypothetical protein J6X55_17430 [Victivallales bacterium]|nr:hypothetical protein [Victivallales bacterium]